jgi:phosphatidylglycerophosphate synthase
MVARAVTNRRRTLFLFVNSVSLLRLPLGGLFLYTYIDDAPAVHRLSLVTIALAVLTDFADGALARRFGVATKFGYLIDGITDRAAYVAVVLGIAMRDGFPLLLAYILILRDFFLYGCRSYYPRWIEQLPLQRAVAHFHAGALRAVFGVYLVADAAVSLGFARRTHANYILRWMPYVTIVLACASYYSLWLVFRQQASLHNHVPVDELEE